MNQGTAYLDIRTHAVQNCEERKGAGARKPGQRWIQNYRGWAIMGQTKTILLQKEVGRFMHIQRVNSLGPG